MSLHPLHPTEFPTMQAMEGIQLWHGAAGIRYKDRDDLLLVSLPEGCITAGVFTQSKTRAAPVESCLYHLHATNGKSRAILVNSGNANAFTGKQGIAAVENTIALVANHLHIKPAEVLPCSTGVIGEVLPTDPIKAALPNLKPANWEDAARTIMTTDAFIKLARREVMIGDTPITLQAIAKGAGMIAPDMATMLAFCFTDAAIDQPMLQTLLRNATAKSFNAITVDSDTSTNDTLLLSATGTAGNTPFSELEKEQFAEALESMLLELAMMLVRDGEGATKLAHITVEEAESDEAARRIALSVANSPLVKTALYGEDPNWGRMVAAIGKSGEAADRDQLWIEIGPNTVAEHGMVAANYHEPTVAAYMKQAEIDIRIGVGVGSGSFTVHTCDMGYDYIRINADYRS